MAQRGRPKKDSTIGQCGCKPPDLDPNDAESIGAFQKWVMLEHLSGHMERFDAETQDKLCRGMIAALRQKVADRQVAVTEARLQHALTELEELRRIRDELQLAQRDMRKREADIRQGAHKG